MAVYGRYIIEGMFKRKNKPSPSDEEYEPELKFTITNRIKQIVDDYFSKSNVRSKYDRAMISVVKTIEKQKSTDFDDPDYFEYTVQEYKNQYENRYKNIDVRYLGNWKEPHLVNINLASRGFPEFVQARAPIFKDLCSTIEKDKVITDLIKSGKIQRIEYFPGGYYDGIKIYLT